MSTYESTRAVFPATGAGRPALAADLIDGVLRLVRTWRKRARQRHELAQMGVRGLRDIGADQVTAELEVRRHFWQQPILGHR
jgi:uncharacterized protein YjiS (DUF1127 family)